MILECSEVFPKIYVQKSRCCVFHQMKNMYLIVLIAFATIFMSSRMLSAKHFLSVYDVATGVCGSRQLVIQIVILYK